MDWVNYFGHDNWGGESAGSIFLVFGIVLMPCIVFVINVVYQYKTQGIDYVLNGDKVSQGKRLMLILSLISGIFLGLYFHLGVGVSILYAPLVSVVYVLLFRGMSIRFYRELQDKLKK
jgi:hypothetical protein